VFAGRSGVQHWKLEGAILRKVRITGKRDMSLRARDSVFEECSFSKDDNWYNHWWSTRWKFENSIFTKSFVRGELPPLDYAAHAIGCTFYGVDLPRIGMKENPAGYLQKENMGFVKCRFVDCDVPESFLAATVDCVFEACRFQGKRHDWPKETGPSKVNAFYSGTGSAPKSFINGPLTVVFAPAPRDVGAGSTLPHTQTAGRVTITNLRDPGPVTMLGAVAKKATEIPVSADPVSALPPKPGAPVGTIPTVPGVAVAPKAPVHLHSLADVLRPLPTGIELMKAGQLNVAGIEAANAWLAKNLPGRTASMRMMLESAQAFKEEGYAFKTTSRPQSVISRGVTIPAQLVAQFRPEDAAAIANVSKGRELAVRGVVQKAILEGRGRAIVLTVTLDEARLQ
jgi:hypothetical protein